MDTGSPADVAAGSDAGVLQAAAMAALEYAESIDDRPAVPDSETLAALATFDEALPDAGADPLATLRLLPDVGSPATVASTGRCYFGFVIGSAHPVALGSAWLLSAWDQNAALPVMSPVAAKLHDVVRTWLVDLLRLPADTAVAFVTGATVANASCLAAGRDAPLARLGWDAQADGLFGAPAFEVVIGERAHSTLSKSLGLVGLGRERVTVVPADDQGRMRADLVAGLDRADSWATDGHTWLNVTYDCGIAFVRRAADLHRTFAAAAGYLPPDAGFEAMHHTPQSSQRARQTRSGPCLRTLGRRGVADLVTGGCHGAEEPTDAEHDDGYDCHRGAATEHGPVEPEVLGAVGHVGSTEFAGFRGFERIPERVVDERIASSTVEALE